MALRQGRAAPAPAVHGELVVEAVGEAVAGAHVAGGHSCWLLLSRATVGTWSTSSPSLPGGPGPAGWGWMAAGAGRAARARAGTTGSWRCGPGGGWGNMVSIVTIN